MYFYGSFTMCIVYGSFMDVHNMFINLWQLLVRKLNWAMTAPFQGLRRIGSVWGQLPEVELQQMQLGQLGTAWYWRLLISDIFRSLEMFSVGSMNLLGFASNWFFIFAHFIFILCHPIIYVYIFYSAIGTGLLALGLLFHDLSVLTVLHPSLLFHCVAYLCFKRWKPWRQRPSVWPLTLFGLFGVTTELRKLVGALLGGKLENFCVKSEDSWRLLLYFDVDNVGPM